MSTALTVSDREQLSYLAVEIKSITDHAYEEAARTVIAAKHMIGEAIVTSELYQKYGKGQSKLFSEIGKQAEMRRSTLAECVKFYETYPRRKAELIADELYTKHGSWGKIRIALYGGDVSAAAETSRCKHCPIHCK